jgi:hypothetical protein
VQKDPNEDFNEKRENYQRLHEDIAKKLHLPSDDTTASEEGQDDSDSKDNLEEDRLSVSRDRAISALSQPPNAKDRAISALSKSDTEPEKTQPSKPKQKLKRDTLLPKAAASKRQEPPPNQRPRSKDSFSSLLPPPMEDRSKKSGKVGGDADISNGLSSWEDFLGGGSLSNIFSNRKPNDSFLDNNSKFSSRSKSSPDSTSKKSPSPFDSAGNLPSITDLFPPDLSATLRNKSAPNMGAPSSRMNSTSLAPPPPSLDGVLPVSDLFYRSAQSMIEDDEVMRDDEELPFSAEQSDQLTTQQNKIKIRRNQASKPYQPQRLYTKRQKPAMSPRKMIRRGMEMLVGGVPINADPPQRYVDLLYQHEAQWHEVISINSRDFGPMFHTSSVSLLSKMELGLFCEHFVHSTMKWDVCPKHLKAIVKSQTTVKESIASASLEVSDVETRVSTHYDEQNPDSHVNLSLVNDDDDDVQEDQEESPQNRQARRHPKKPEAPGRGFGKVNNNLKDSKTSGEEIQTHLGGELVFSIGVSKEELESGDNGSQGRILERVLARGISAASESTGFDVRFTKLGLTDMDDGTTMINGEFTLEANESMSFSEMEKKAQRINSSLAQAMNDGDMQLAMAAAARAETSWPEEVRDRVVEEFLFEDDDGDGPLYDTEEDEPEGAANGMAEKNRSPEDTLSSLKDMDDDDYDYDGPFGMPDSNNYHKDDIFLGGGNDGVFWDYSEANAANAPYKGELGLRLVDAVVERAKARHPRVIAIGDVHGCIDELQDLLRECDYSPGDLVVFLGDLVSKGPDSISVVQMAREIGAMGVRGNHDFEVIRWHQAIKSGVDPPVVGSEHFHIASCLSNADMKWMYSLPWYLSSKELGALFVHAGFVSGIRLAKQNPRLMMNMRSILPDGTVTSKFFNNWPWARLWDGPQTVLFGHDADRGLQQYEHAIGLDTGCVYGGRLTACILPEKRLVSVSAKREYFKYRRKHYD